ncbi:Asp-tRNA(Asn)/Glu-tRNA(Gln) amidotransferase subunit GatA [Candidatus Bipolaricaulota bacterium]|nr:Asp-tRNA(Asn)/Glu-tRNA(Gln) amidotransferase subunit GatA [Candidatus Bipolaricaulota bacterium]
MSLNELTLHELIDLLEESPGKLEKLINDLFAEIDDNEPDVQAYLELASSDELLKSTRELVDQPLKGIPGTIKDNIQTLGFKTTCGSKFLEDYDSVYDATVIKSLKEAGSPVLGKANMDEFAMGSSTENSYFQTTRNPHDLSRVPGGSSGGSAAAVAADEAVYALGSDTGGSVRHPAAFCGVVGMKPTYGLVSRYGLTAFASSLDQIGPITKDVYDSALLLNYLARHDEMDSTSAVKKTPDYTEGIDRGIEGLKVGLPKEYFGKELDSRIQEKAKKWRKTFENLGADVVEISLPNTEYAIATYYIIASSEASANLARFDGVRYTSRADTDSIEELFSRSRDEGFGPEVKRRILLGTYALSAGYYDEYYGKAQKARRLIKQDFDRAFENVDLIAAPTSPTPAFKIGEKIEDPLEMYLSDVFIVPVNLAGIPAMSMSGGKVNDLPVGMQIMGGSLAEKKILRAGYAFERNFED